jgi:2-dehydropantoate 2-reductase
VSYPLAIIGPGALGLVFAERLSRHMRVALIARSEGRARELRAGVTVDDAAFVPDAHPAGNPPDAGWILVLVKAADTRAAAQIAARMSPRGVLSLQNGWVEALLREPLMGVLAAQGVTTEAAWRQEREVRHTGAGETLAPPGFEELVGLLQGAGFRARIEPRIVEARMRKLLVSTCINPLTALYRIPNGMACEPPYATHFTRLAHEGAAILRATGVDIDDRAALELARGVARATARNRSSMLQDVEAGRETEAEFLTGALLEMASAHGVAAPTHQALDRFLRKEHSAEQAKLALESRSSQDGLADVGRRREGS